MCQGLANAHQKNRIRSLTPVLRFPPYCFWLDNTRFITVRRNMRVSSGGKFVSPRVYALAETLLKQRVQGISKSWYVYSWPGWIHSYDSPFWTNKRNGLLVMEDFPSVRPFSIAAYFALGLRVIWLWLKSFFKTKRKSNQFQIKSSKQHSDGRSLACELLLLRFLNIERQSSPGDVRHPASLNQLLFFGFPAEFSTLYLPSNLAARQIWAIKFLKNLFLQ